MIYEVGHRANSWSLSDGEVVEVMADTELTVTGWESELLDEYLSEARLELCDGPSVLGCAPGFEYRWAKQLDGDECSRRILIAVEK